MRIFTILIPLLVVAATCVGDNIIPGSMNEFSLESEHISSDNTERLIPRSVLFGNPERIRPQLSPDGSMIAYIAPAEAVLNLWVMNRDLSNPDSSHSIPTGA